MLRLPRLSPFLFVIAFLLGLFFTFAVPPFQKTDEVVHYYKAVSLAHGNIVCKAKQNNPIARYLFTFPSDMLAIHIAENTNVKFARQLYETAWKAKTLDTRRVNEPSSCSLPFLFYMVPAVAIAVPIALTANPLIIFFIGRLAAFFVGFALLYWAYRIAPQRYKPLMVFMTLLPTVQFQLSSFSKDALHIPLGILAAAQFFALRAKTKQLTVASFALFFVPLLLAVMARPSYAPLLFIVFLTPALERLISEINRQSFLIVVALSAATTAVLSTAIFFGRQYIDKALYFLSVSPHGFVNAPLQLRFLSLNPWQLGTVLSATLEKQMAAYVSTLVGVTGWIGPTMPWWVTIVFVGWGLVILADITREKEHTSWWEVVVSVITVVATLLTIIVSLYIFGTPVASPTVDGVQGRYFIVLLPFALWAISVMLRQWKHLVVIVFGVGLLAAAGTQIYERYYHYDTYLYQDAYQSFEVTKKMEFRKISTPFQQLEPVVAGKKMAGVALYIPPQKDFQQHAYVVSVRDHACHAILGQTVIHMAEFPHDKFLWLRFAPVSTDETEVCVQIEYFGEKQQDDKPMELVYDPKTKRFVVTLLYVY